MIAGLEPYPAYKDSGVPWLGEVPEGWQLLRIRDAVDSRMSIATLHATSRSLFDNCLIGLGHAHRH